MTEPHGSHAPPARSRGRLIVWGEWAHSVFVASAIVAIHFGGDRWGWATMVAYGPRAAFLLPGVLLLPLAIWRRRGWVTMAAIVAALVGVLGLRVPWRSLLPALHRTASLRVLELNVNGADTDGKAYDPRRLADLVARESPDIVDVAEWASADAPPTVGGVPWNVRRVGQALVATRFTILRSAAWSGGPLGGEGEVVGCELAMDDGRTAWCFGVHLETPRRGFEPVLRRQPNASRLLAESIARRQRLSADAVAFVRRTAGDADVIVLGDFNQVADGAIFRSTWGRWPDAFDRAGWGFGWTKYQDHWGVRIDHVLASDPWHAVRCAVGPDVGSDHLPLLATLDRAD